MVETELLKQQDSFKETINATISRSDQASFSSSLALQAAISSPQSVVTRRGGTTVVQNPNQPDSNVINIPAAATNTDTTSFVMTKSNNMQFIKFQNQDDGIALEPTVMLDQMTTYLNHLNQLRRTNEGDDTADAPGYALHLIRIPVSVIPGKKTQQGFGAEITITAEPVITDSLLPTVFRSLVTNDVVDLASDVMFDLVINPLPTQSDPGVPPSPGGANDDSARKAYAAKMSVWMNRCGTSVLKRGSSAQKVKNPNPTRSAGDVFSLDMFKALSGLVNDQSMTTGGDQQSNPQLLLDVRKVAQRQVEAAYTLLAATGNEDLWNSASPVLLTAIRNCNQRGGDGSVEVIRREFVKAIASRSGNSLYEDTDATIALAWAIIYNATLLNQQLLEDMARVAADCGGACHPTANWLEFFITNPLPEARQLFAMYVRARWPIHVFAIDPMTTDQNVADDFSRRREMQLALSLAFTSGQIGAQSFTRFARRLELDMQTIALNRTQVGFSHGNDTFGWRFFPRVQSPPTEGNATVLFRDLLMGGPTRNQELDKMKLEPGARECVALVIMPTFIPNVRFDTRTNWFRLSNPKKKEFDLQTNVALGTNITCLRDYTACCQGDQNVRGTDLALLLRSVDQLEHRLPLQTCVAQVPFDLTHSGHTFFNHGIANLGPELRGYYGEPGAAGKDISVAVVGSNFSVCDTNVIAGNQLLTPGQVTMLSREVMVLTIPAAALTSGNTIDVHVATPYGVSNHLAINLPKPKAPSNWTIKPQSVDVTYATDDSINDGDAGHFAAKSYTPAVVAQFSGTLATAPKFVNFTFTFAFDGGPKDLTVRGVLKESTGDYIIDVKELSKQLLNELIDQKQINDNKLPETSTYSLSPISVDTGFGGPQPIDGALVINFKPKPKAKPAQ